VGQEQAQAAAQAAAQLQNHPLGSQAAAASIRLLAQAVGHQAQPGTEVNCTATSLPGRSSEGPAWPQGVDRVWCSGGAKPPRPQRAPRTTSASSALRPGSAPDGSNAHQERPEMAIAGIPSGRTQGFPSFSGPGPLDVGIFATISITTTTAGAAAMDRTTANRISGCSDRFTCLTTWE